MKSIGIEAFSDCSHIRIIHCKASAPPTLGSSAFYGLNVNHVKVYVPKRRKDAYAFAKGWDAFLNIIEEEDESVSDDEQKEELIKANEKLKRELAALQKEINELMEENKTQKNTIESLNAENTDLTQQNGRLTKENTSLKTENATLSDELALYRLGDLNKDGKTDLEDMMLLLTMDSYSGDADALAQLTEDTAITLTQIDERYGDVEYYKLNGVKMDKPTQPGVYLVKKDGKTKMIVVKK